jgi:hypothetical protein
MSVMRQTAALGEVALTVISVIRETAEVAAVGIPVTVRAAAITTATAVLVAAIEEIVIEGIVTVSVSVIVIVKVVVFLAGKDVEVVERERGVHEVIETGIVVAIQGIVIEATAITTGPRIVTGQSVMMTVVAEAGVEVAVVGKTNLSPTRIRYFSLPCLTLCFLGYICHSTVCYFQGFRARYLTITTPFFFFFFYRYF